MLLRAVRSPGSGQVYDLRVRDGVIAAVGPRLPREDGEEVHDAAGAVVIPGLWDQHVHVGQTAQGYSRLDTSAVTGVDAALDRVREALRDRPAGAGALVGFGHHLAEFAVTPTVAALDQLTGTGEDATAVVLIGGDAHHAWMNTAALRGLGLPPHDGVVGEDEWFETVTDLDDLPGVAAGLEYGVALLQRDALERGVVGLVDMEWAENWRLWQQRTARLRVRTATYAVDLDRVPGPTGTVLDADGLVRMGPLKVIADGALGSRSAYSHLAYASSPAGDHEHGLLSVDREHLLDLLERARQAGLEVAVHAIGDRAAAIVLDAFAEAGRPGRIEHAQMLADADVTRLADLGLVASVQPAHLLEDRDLTEQLWAAHADRAYRFRDLQDAGARIVFGSDSPVAPVDPWLAMAAAVHRSADARPGWLPRQSLQPLEALAASTDGVETLDVGGVADLVLLEEDPFDPVPIGADGWMEDAAAREAAARLRAVSPLATVVAGRIAHER